ncbi:MULTISPECIES: hypothetical protein [unclassified Ruegeria]|uniref:hypothetical protein n=1 Tax=unclassified Ruegeria TaxID=2625375 RepID=UPI0014892EE6|nr:MULTISPECIES: hypothetical protein [unclassified Ruegeria]
MSAIGRRIVKSQEDMEKKDYESAATAMFQALDATAKKRYPKEPFVGNRVRSLITDQEDIISRIGFGTIVIGSNYGGATLAQAIWKFARNPLIQDGELDPRMSFENDLGVTAIGDVWNFNPSFLMGLSIAIVSAKENAGEAEFLKGGVFENGVYVPFQSMWGAEDMVRHILRIKKLSS